MNHTANASPWKQQVFVEINQSRRTRGGEGKREIDVSGGRRCERSRISRATARRGTPFAGEIAFTLAEVSRKVANDAAGNERGQAWRMMHRSSDLGRCVVCTRAGAVFIIVSPVADMFIMIARRTRGRARERCTFELLI